MNKRAQIVWIKILCLAFACITQPLTAEISYERLLADEDNGADWLSYSGGYRSERFAPMTQINRETVANLKVIWAYQMQPTDIEGAGLVETTPLVAEDRKSVV